MQVLLHGKVVGTSQKWPAKAGGRSPKGPAVAGTTVQQLVNIIVREFVVLKLGIGGLLQPFNTFTNIDAY